MAISQCFASRIWILAKRMGFFGAVSSGWAVGLGFWVVTFWRGGEGAVILLERILISFEEIPMLFEETMILFGEHGKVSEGI